MLTERAEELLESLWTAAEAGGASEAERDEAAEKELVAAGAADFGPGGGIRLTPTGESLGRDVVRRHRLAERLLADVLDVRGALMDETACAFEHVLHRDIADRICAMLGHPRISPHGHEIPPGPCCERGTAESPLVAPLSRLAPGQKGVLAYLHASDPQHLQKIMALGLLPGATIELVQSFPAFLFRVGHSEFAVDRTIADEMFVRIGSGQAQPSA